MDLPENSNIDSLFKKQGILGNQDFFSDEVILKIVLAYFEITKCKNIVIATDMRSKSAKSLDLISKLAKDKDIQISSLGIVSIEQLLFAITNNAFDGGIMISPNIPIKEQFGLRFLDNQANFLDGKTIFNQYNQITELPNLDNSEQVIQSVSVTKDFFFNTLKDIDPIIWKNHKIIVDAGNGLGGESLCKLLEKIPQLNTIGQFLEPDDSFMHHMPYLEDQNNTKELSDSIKINQADFGILLNHDGDRILFLDDKGDYIEPVYLSALLISIILERNPNSKFGLTNEIKWVLEESIQQKENIVYLNSDIEEIKKVSKELDIDFSTDTNGLLIFKASNYSINSLFSISLIIEHLSNKNLKLSESIFEIRNNFFINKGLYLLNPDQTIDSTKLLLDESFDGNTEQNITKGFVLDDPNFRISVIECAEPRFIQIFIETKSELLIQEVAQKVENLMQKFSIKKVFSDPLIIQSFEYSISPREKFETLLNNFWFTWNPHHILPIIELYGDGWRKNSPPEVLMVNYGKDKLAQLLQSRNWELDQNLRLFNAYMSSNDRFNDLVNTDIKFKIFETKPIVYFCLEYGFVDWLQIYSGGLGILAGDYIKQASDSGLPVIGIGLFYHQGYLHQDFSPDGLQLENYIHQDPLDYNMSIAKDKEDKPIIIELPMGDSVVKIRAWKQMVGKSVMYLLDTNFEENREWEDRLITGYLYGGDIENRIRQEIVLGIGGAKLIERLGITPSIYHMNEGHSGFLIFERMRQIMKEKNISFDQALSEEKTNLIFTNHTLKQAGNDIFDFMLFEKYLGPYANELGVSINTMFSLGDDKTYSQGGFSMTVFCMLNAAISNAVSIIHSSAAKNIWKDFELVPVTNGVHLPTWVSPEIHAILDKYLGEKWHSSTKFVDLNKIDKIPSKLLWEAHLIRKTKLIKSLNSVLGLNLKPEILTIAWSRRLAAYKRPDLIITDIERLKSIVSNIDRPVQILIAGKSHPKDTIGKQLLQKINQSFSEEFFKDKIEVIPGYNWQLARRIVSGTDIWLNTPYRYEEACGTSGMKAAANGVIQFTTLDGWTDEVDWYKIGWVIDENNPSSSLYNYLENNIAPLYYSKNEQGFNEDWVTMMKNSIKLILRDFSSERMLNDYLSKVYNRVI